MKKIWISLLMLMVSASMLAQTNAVSIDEEHFPDRYFRQWVSKHFQPEQIPTVTELRLKSDNWDDHLYDVTSIEGIEYFENLETVHFEGMSRLHGFDFSKNTKLKSFSSYDLSISGIDFSGCPELMAVYLHGYTSSDISFGANPHLQSLIIYGANNLQSLNLSANSELKGLSLVSCPSLETLDLSHNVALSDLYLYYCGLSSVDFSANQQLSHFEAAGLNLAMLNLSSNHALKRVSVSECRLLSSLLLSPEMTLLGTEANVDVEHLNYIDATVDIQGLSSLSRDAVDDIVNSLPIVNEPTILNALDTNITAGTIQKAVNKGWIVFFTSSDGNVYNTYDNPEIIPTAISSAVAEDVPLVFYNLQGRRLNVSPAKGFYIKGGRKYVVK